MAMHAISDTTITRRMAVPGMPGAFIMSSPEVPPDLSGGQPAGPGAQATPGHLLYSVAGIGRFLSRHGDCIAYHGEAQADPGAIALILHGSARTALIHQRGELPLHAATVLGPGGAVAICGPSGAGKSTLAAELVARGWPLIADDTTRLTWDGAAVLAWPSRGLIKLWRDACERRGIAVAPLERVMRDLDKYYLPVPFHDAPEPLTTVVVLGAAEAGPPASFARMSLIIRNTARFSYVRPLNCQSSNLAMASKIVTHCRFLQLATTPRRAVAALADTIERSL
jgi:hypothetical protein